MPPPLETLRQILPPWRTEAPALWLGAAATLASVLALAALVLAAAAVSTPTALVATPLLLALLLALRALGAARVILRYLERLATHRATFRALAALRVWMFRNLARRAAHGLGFLHRGDALARLVTDVDALDGLYLRILIPLLAALLLLPLLAVVLAPASPALAAAVCTLYAIAVLLVPWRAARAALAQGAPIAEAAAALRIAAIDAVSGLREVTAFGNEGRVLAGIQAREAALFDAQRSLAKGAARAHATGLLCANAALLLVLLAAPASAILPALLLTLAAFEAAGALPRAGAMAGSATAAAARILAAAPPPATPATPAPPAPAPAPAQPRPATPALSFHDVHFAWPGRPPTFTGLSLEIPPGARVAILGPSGSGKSTLAALALKAATPGAGHIRLDGVDIATLPDERVRAQVAWLSQSTHVFEDTIAANLRLARPEADDAQLWTALAQAGLAEIVHALPHGLATWIAPKGVPDATNLSGGQLRRLALARALLSPAPILILDEPATGLDDTAERAFLATLEATPGRTIILIVHRLLGPERPDRIWRLSANRAIPATS